MKKKNVRKYGYKPFCTLPVPAQVVGEELSRIRAKYGRRFKPAHLVKEAQKVNNPLHPCFEWNTQKAAMAHWLDQARFIIRVVVVVKVDDRRLPPGVRAVTGLVVKSPDGRKEYDYVDTICAMSTESGRRRLLEEALRELQMFKDKYAHLAELAGLMRAIERLLDRKKKPLKKKRRP